MPKIYRPITLTSVAGKLMERGIANTLYEHLSCNGLLSSVQHGFVKGKSTCTNLLECVKDWTLILQDKSSVTVAYVNFSKAFDTVSHAKLFARLHASLELQRLHLDLVFCYKIVFGLVSVNLDDFFRDSICFGDKRSSIQAI